MSLELDFHRCVRSRSPAAGCRACADACPTGAVRLEAATGALEVALEACTGCGLCQAACPTDAIAGAVDVEALLASARGRVACGEGGLPCVGALHPEDLVVLALRRGGLQVVGRPCLGGELGHRLARAAVEEARALGAAVGAPVRLDWSEEDGPPPPAPPAPPPALAAPARRRFLAALAPGVVSPPPPVLRQPDGFRRELGRATRRRGRLLRSLPSGVHPAQARALLRGFATKVVDEAACTRCGDCATACPTGSLELARGALRLEPSRCVACKLCDEVCAPGAISSKPEVEVEAILEFGRKVLVAPAREEQR